MLAMSTLVVMFIDNFLFVKAIEVNVSTIVPQVNRTSKEVQERLSNIIQLQYPELRSTLRKSNFDDHNTYSSLMTDIIVGTSSTPTRNNKVYPSLTTSSPNFVTRGRFISNPFYVRKEDHDMEFKDDPQSELIFNSGYSKWNRYAICSNHIN